VRDSGQTLDPADPGSPACGPPGQNVWCAGDVEGARLAEAWKSFRGWTQSVLAFGTAAQTIPAGAPSAAMSLSLVTSSGLAVVTPTTLAVTLSSSSPEGSFSTSPAGPWSSTLSLTIAPGTGTAAEFYYRDTRAGSHVLTASAAGATSGTQTVTVAPGPVATVIVTPASATVRARASQGFAAAGADAYGNPVPVSAAWSVTPPILGTVTPGASTATTFTARRTLGSGTILAYVATEAGPLSAGTGVRVTPGRLRIGSIRYRGRKDAVFVTASAIDAAGRPVSRAVVSVALRRNGRSYLSARGATGAAGRTVYRVPARRGGCFTTVIRRVSSAGFAWDGRTPRNRFCRPRQ